jgi:hypothetical protein
MTNSLKYSITRFSQGVWRGLSGLTLLLSVLLTLSSVKASTAQDSDTLQYLFLGHTYKWGSGGTEVDQRLQDADLSRFDRIWLGGDVCSESTLEYQTLLHIDNLFDIGAPGNHWALGNHDTRTGNIQWITELTGRPRFYAYYQQGITTLVLDGTMSPLDCEGLDAQYRMIQSVCDTISSGHLIFLVHHGIYKSVPGVLDPNVYGHSGLKNWLANCYEDDADYLNSIYPMLVNLEENGIEVYHVMGDVGAGFKKYHGTSDEGIDFLGSGINNSYNIFYNIPITEFDEVLIFYHIPETNQLWWEFVLLNDL